MPMQQNNLNNHHQKPYESFECANLNPLEDTSSPENADSTLTYTKLPPGDKLTSGYLPITCLPGVEQPTRLLLAPNTPDDSQDDDDSMSQIKTTVKRSETAPGYVVVEATPNTSKAQSPVRVGNLSAIPKGYVKAAEIPNLTTSLEQTSPPVNKTTNLPYTTLNTDINPKTKLNTTNSNGYVQHTITN